MPGLSSADLVDALDAAGVCVSAGSACSAAKALPSYVLQAMGLPEWRTTNALRISFGPATDEATIVEACRRIRHCGEALRRAGMLAGAPESPLNGVVQVAAGKVNSWLLLDAEQGMAVIIDSRPETRERIATILLRHRYEHVIELSTKDAVTWPYSDDRITVGGSRLRRIVIGAQGVCYVLETADGQPRLAFTGELGRAELASVLPSNTILCGGESEATYSTVKVQQASDVDRSHDIHLDRCGLQVLLREQPSTALVDVREAFEHFASAHTDFMEFTVNVPVTQLANALPAWLADTDRTPIVFVCRSGNRSERAARHLRKLGYEQAFHLSGGIALTPPVPLTGS